MSYNGDLDIAGSSALSVNWFIVNDLIDISKFQIRQKSQILLGVDRVENFFRFDPFRIDTC